MIIQPISAKDYYENHVERWFRPNTSQSNADYSSLRSYLVNTLYSDTFGLNSKTADSDKKVDSSLNEEVFYEALADEGVVNDLDFYTATSASCDARVTFRCKKDGLMHGWLGWFDMRLGNSWLSTSPSAERTHWSQVFFPLEYPIDVKSGEQVSLKLSRPEGGEWSWRTKSEEVEYRQSTFLSCPRSLDEMKKHSIRQSPTLDAVGSSARFVLSQFDGAASVEEIALRLLEQSGSNFESEQEAIRFVKQMVEKFAA